MTQQPCRTCGLEQATCKGQCHTCDEYQRRTSTPRPKDRIVARVYRQANGRQR